MSHQPFNEAASMQDQTASWMYPQPNLPITNESYQQLCPAPLLYNWALPFYGQHAPLNMPQSTDLMPHMANWTQTETQKKAIEEGIAKLRRLNILDSDFERKREKYNLKHGTTIDMPAFNRSRRLELLRAKKPVAFYKPFILNRWTQEDYVRHKILREKHMKKEDPELNNTAEKKLMQDNGRRVTMKTVKADVLRKFMKPYQTTDRWFLVVDTKVLLDDMWFVEKMVKSDPYCRVKLPYEALHDLSQMTMKSRPAWMRAPARRVVQLLDTKSGPHEIINQQGVIENEDLVDNPLATDAVLNCCMQIMRSFYFVVLVTDDEKRRENAKTIDLPAFSFAEVKDMVTMSYTNLHFGHITVTREMCTYNQNSFILPREG